MSSPSPYTRWSETRSMSSLDTAEWDENSSDTSSSDSELISPDHDEVDDNDEFHEEEFLGILALAELARESFAASSQTDDLEDYIAYLRDALMVAPHEGLARAELLHTLAHNLYVTVTEGKLMKGELMERLNECVDLHRSALHFLPAYHEARAQYMERLADALRERSVQCQNDDDLQEFIVWQSRSLSLRPQGHPDRARSLMKLASGYRMRHDRWAEVQDLNEAIRLDVEALTIRPPGHLQRAESLLHVASDLAVRFSKLGHIADLERAIDLQREALSLASSQTDRLNTTLYLASYLFSHYQAMNHRASLDDALQVCSQELEEAHSAPDTLRFFILRFLSRTALTHFLEGSRELCHLQNAVRYCRQAVETFSEGSITADKLDAYITLAEALAVRFTNLHDSSDADEAIHICSQAVHICPSAHPYHSRCLRALARAYATRYEILHDSNDLLEALAQYKKAVESPYGFARERATYGQEWFALILRTKSASSFVLDAFMSTADSLRHLALFDTDPQLRNEILTSTITLVEEATQYCLSLLEPKIAMEVFEQGQAIIWTIRNPVSSVPSILYERLHGIAQEISGPQADSSRVDLLTARGHLNLPGIHEAASVRSNLVDEFRSLLDHIRHCRGLSDFLLPIRYTSLVSDWNSGPIIFLMAQPSCQAIVYSPVVQDTTQVPLLLTIQQLKGISRGFLDARKSEDDQRCASLLDTVWRTIVSPVFQNLGYLNELQAGVDKPRIWWCPTELFANIPLHAAGQKVNDPRAACAMDYAVCSYSPTMAALRSAQHRCLAGNCQVAIAASDLQDRRTGLPALEMQTSSSTDSSIASSPLTPTSGRFSTPIYRALPETFNSTSIACLTCPNERMVTSPLLEVDNFELSDSERAMMTDGANPSSSNTPITSPNVHSPRYNMPISEEQENVGFVLLYSGFQSVLGTLPGWQSTRNDTDITAVVEQIYAEAHAQNITDLHYATFPYTLDKAIRNLRNSGLPLTRWIPFIHIGY